MHIIMIICHWEILPYNMSFQTIAGRSDGVFWWFPALSEDQDKICRINQNYLVALRHKLKQTYFCQNCNSISSSITSLKRTTSISKMTYDDSWKLLQLSDKMSIARGGEHNQSASFYKVSSATFIFYTIRDHYTWNLIVQQLYQVSPK